MKPYYEADGVTLHLGDCRDVLASLADASVDAIVTDPPAGISFMGREWDQDKGGRDRWIAWLTGVMEQAHRVLKPGGHALVWALPRTSHWTATALEDAGFEIRDCIVHIFGSGWPKSLDVSKAIDRAEGAEREVIGNTAESSGRTIGLGTSAGYHGDLVSGHCRDITLPATEDAARWDGWGTALKPGQEHWWLCRKPLVSPATNVLEMVELGLRKLGVTGEIRWKPGPARNAARSRSTPNSFPTAQPVAAGTSAEPVGGSAKPDTGNATAKLTGRSSESGQPTTLSASSNTDAPVPNGSEPKSSLPTATSAPAAASDKSSSSHSTTSTVADRLTESPSTARSTNNSGEKASRPATAFFAGIATGLTGSRALVRIKQADDGSFCWPHGLPESVPGSALTVAANVLTYGTGALNIGGCRIASTGPEINARAEKGNGLGYHGADGIRGGWTGEQGRWPTNLVFSHSSNCGEADCSPDCPVAELDRQSGVRRAGGDVTGHEPSARFTDTYGQINARVPFAKHRDEGGASRFFPTFRYEAKAPASERPKLADGTAHPTVKPLALMKFLTRLVTPPDGLVLDPFAGSGTTGEACVVEGFRCLLIEADERHAELVKARLSKPLQPTLFGGEAS